MSLQGMNRQETLDMAMLLGKILLKSGAETYRVEDTITRFCAHFNFTGANVFVTPTIIIIGDEKPDGYSCICRMRNRTTNLRLISEVNDFTYNLKKWPLDYRETMAYLQAKLEESPPYRTGWICLASGIGSASFSGMLGGNGYDFVAAFITGFLAMQLLKALRGYRPSDFWENALAGAAIGLVAIICCVLCPACTLEKIIVGAVMPFVPGLAYTNGLRDYIAGDLISGNSRIAEALLFAVSIAVGLAFILELWLDWGWSL